MEYPSSLINSQWFLGFAGILRDANKILSKNGKLMASIIFLGFLLNSLVYVFSVLSLKLVLKNLLGAYYLLVTKVGDPEFINLFINLKNNCGFLFGLLWIQILVNFIVLLFLSITTILASAINHDRKDITLSFSNLVSQAIRSWKRPFVTSIYTALFGTGYIFLLLEILLPLVLLLIQLPAALHVTTIAVGVLASVFSTYITVFFTLALVISVLDQEMFGFEAFGKAATIVKGMKVQGFLLNLLFAIVTSFLVQGIRLIPITKSTVLQLIIGLVVTNSILLVRIFWLIAYTIFYYQCKKNHGEEVELPGSTVAYTEIPTKPQIGEDVL